MAAVEEARRASDPSPVKRYFQTLLQGRLWWWLPLVVWTLLVGASLRYQTDAIRRHSFELSQSSAREIFNLVVLVRRWNANHGGVYVPVTEKFQPNPYLKVPWRDVVTQDGRPLTLVNPAFMTRLVGELAEQKDGIRLHITSLKPLRPANAADASETRALESFAAGGKERTWIEADGKGGQLFRYMAPLWVEKPCLQCHAEQGYKIGDLRGGISVSFSEDRTMALEAARIRQTVILHGAVYLLVVALGWWLLEQLRWRMQHLNQQVVAMRSAMEHVLRDEKMASLGRMVAGFAHEVNTPIGVALGALSNSDVTLARIDALLAAEEVSEEDLRRELGLLKSGADMAQANLVRAANLIQSFKRTSVDQTSDAKRVYDMKELLQDVLYMLHNYLKRLPITVHTECPRQLRIDGWPGQMQQLLTNLVINSLTHGFPDDRQAGEIRIVVTLATPERVRIDYSDTGQGMTPEVRSHVFESFYTTRRDSGGSGLGLSICQDIVEHRLQGSIVCESEPGAGTRFIVEFPATVVGTVLP
ncbi:ATP-binding protein [Parasulfuritortus cantonensis]|nr:ATP-binding protein [Parasulfuritortus cantonensis]